MPRGDRTGPMGLGPMSGRGAGYCAGFDQPGYANPYPGAARGAGFGRGGFFGGGRGWRHWYNVTGLPRWARGYWGPMGPYGPQANPPAWAPPAPGEEMEELKAQADYFEESLKEIKKRIAELESQPEKKG